MYTLIMIMFSHASYHVPKRRFLRNAMSLKETRSIRITYRCVTALKFRIREVHSDASMVKEPKPQRKTAEREKEEMQEGKLQRERGAER